MSKYKFGACEYNFPMWGSLALEMAHDAGFDGIEITDGGTYLQPHPMNKGYFVEVERLQPNLIRLDNYPLLDKIVQDDYLHAQAKPGIEITGVHLYFLNCQGFISANNESLTGKDALMTIKNAIIAASQMGIPMVSIPTRGMFGVAKNLYALQKLEYAAQVAEEYGIRISNSFDTTLAREMEVIEKLGGKLKADFHTMDPAFNAKEPAPEMIRALGRERIEQFKMKDVTFNKEGYLVTEEMTEGIGEGQPIEVTAANAHSWVEYYQDGVGWIPFEVTPPYIGLMKSGESFGHAGQTEYEPEQNPFPPQQPEKEQEKQVTSEEEVNYLSLFILLVLLAALAAWIIWFLLKHGNWKGYRKKDFHQPDRKKAMMALMKYIRHLEEKKGLPAELAEKRSRIQQIYEEARYSDHQADEEKYREMMDFAGKLKKKKREKGKIA